jgi:RNA polymerase sigma-70 factor (ECF subfamily)
MIQLFRPGPSEPASDEALLAQYKSSGEALYLGQLYERYMPMVYGVCLKLLKDRGLAEDAVMAIYETLDRKVKEHNIESFRGWLYVLSRNHCLMEWRKKQRRPTDLHAPENMVYYDAIESPFEVELPGAGQSLQNCLKTLPESQRRSVELFYFEEKSYKEIAEMVQEELGMVRSQIQNGKRNLKKCLSGVMSDE